MNCLPGLYNMNYKQKNKYYPSKYDVGTHSIPLVWYNIIRYNK